MHVLHQKFNQIIGKQQPLISSLLLPLEETVVEITEGSVTVPVKMKSKNKHKNILKIIFLNYTITSSKILEKLANILTAFVFVIRHFSFKHTKYSKLCK